MKLTILGASAAYAGAGEACSGYLIEEGNTRLLVDCGTGVLSNLQYYIPPWRVTHIIISHLHADHFLDLFPLRYALWRLGQGRPYLYLPPGGNDALLRITSLFDPSATFFSEFFRIEEYSSSAMLNAGELVIQLSAVKHYIPSWAIGICGSGRIVYSGDCGPCEGLKQLASGADLFLCEAAKIEPEDEVSWGHLSPGEAAEIAKCAGVKRLVLTHLWPHSDYSLALNMANTIFGKQVEIAKIHHTYEV